MSYIEDTGRDEEFEAWLDACYASADDIAHEQYIHDLVETTKLLAGGCFDEV